MKKSKKISPKYFVKNRYFLQRILVLFFDFSHNIFFKGYKRTTPKIKRFGRNKKKTRRRSLSLLISIRKRH